MPSTSPRRVQILEPSTPGRQGAPSPGLLVRMEAGLLMWRSILHWLGGIGFIGMAVAILPLLRVGGMRLFQTESSDWSEKVVPRSHVAGRYLIAIYVSFTAAAFIGFRLAGMSNFDAINHAMSTVSTGGFSTSDASMASAAE